MSLGIDFSDSSDFTNIGVQLREQVLIPLRFKMGNVIGCSDLHVAVECNGPWFVVNEITNVITEFTRVNKIRCSFDLDTVNGVTKKGFRTSQPTKENGVILLRRFLENNRVLIESGFKGDKISLLEQLERMRKITTGFDLEKGERFTITGKIFSKQRGCSAQDDQAMALLIAVYSMRRDLNDAWKSI